MALAGALDGPLFILFEQHDTDDATPLFLRGKSVSCAVRFEGTNELMASSLDKLEEPASLLALRIAANVCLPRVDIEEILLAC